MMTPFDLGWGNPRDLTSADMVTAEIFTGHKIQVRNSDVGKVMAALVRRLRADGWDGPDAIADEGGYNKRLKRWAQELGHQMATAPLFEWSDHAWGTAVDLDTTANPMLDVRPASPWSHTTMPQSSARIAAGLGLEWGGTWDDPWDPQHYQVGVSPRELAEIAAGVGEEEDLTIMDSQTRGYLDRRFETVVGRLDLMRLGDDPDPPTGDTHPANLDTILQKLNELTADVEHIKRRLDART